MKNHVHVQAMNPPNIPMIEIFIDGKAVRAPRSMTVLEACLTNKAFLPHYCYHPSLPIAGNCRMCLVHIKGQRKPAIACNTPIEEGMEVFVNDEKTKAYQKDVMEMLLINHPLDCPECDQSGECHLQDYAVAYGAGKGKFVEEKVVKTTTNFSSSVRYFGSRCIVCTRCTRFCDDITETGELAVTRRGDKSEITTHKETPLDKNPLSMNIIDLCPVGALCSRDFLYKSRVWELETVSTISGTDSLGCNIVVDFSKQNEIMRIRPRTNLHVNGYFIPDKNRLEYKFVQSPNRFIQAEEKGSPEAQTTDTESAIKKIKESIDENPQKTALLLSFFQSNELFFTAKKWKEKHNLHGIYLYGRPVHEDYKVRKFVIPGDPNPNRRGAHEILGEESLNNTLPQLIDAISKKTIDRLLILSNVPDFSFPQTFIDKLKHIKYYTCHFEHDEHTDNALITIPGQTYFEQTGTWVNCNGRVQRFFPVHEAVTPFSYTELSLLQDLSGETRMTSSAVFNGLASEIEAFAGLDYENIGTMGRPLSGCTEEMHPSAVKPIIYNEYSL